MLKLDKSIIGKKIIAINSGIIYNVTFENKRYFAINKDVKFELVKNNIELFKLWN